MPEMSSWAVWILRCRATMPLKDRVSAAECRSGISRPKTRDSPSALTANAAVTLLSIPPESATTNPLRLRSFLMIERMDSAMRAASASGSRFKRSLEKGVMGSPNDFIGFDRLYLRAGKVFDKLLVDPLRGKDSHHRHIFRLADWPVCLGKTFFEQVPDFFPVKNAGGFKLVLADKVAQRIRIVRAIKKSLPNGRPIGLLGASCNICRQPLLESPLQ